MRKKEWTEYNLMSYEKSWFERLETIQPGELRNLIDYNNAINQSASYKYNTIIKFITILMGMNAERQELAIQIIDKYWTKLEKPSLLGDLFHYAPFEIFQKYYNKARMNPDTVRWFLVAMLKADDVEEFRWFLDHKKTPALLLKGNLTFVNSMLENRMKNAKQEVLDLFFSKEEVVIIAGNYGLDNLLPQTAKDIFLF